MEAQVQPIPQAPQVPQMAQGQAPIVASSPISDTPTSGGGNIMQTLKGLNWLEIGFGILGSATLYYAIYYYKYNLNQRKQFEKDFQNKIDELNIKIADMQSVMNSTKKTNDVLFF